MLIQRYQYPIEIIALEVAASFDIATQLIVDAYRASMIWLINKWV
ncbi:hypothetical protein [Segetibacter sp.]|nr:hypothetical protein [Segetibacter sp.]